MKKILLVPLAVMIIAALIFAGCGGGGGNGGGGGATLTPDQAADHLGEEVTVCGPVAISAYDKMAPIDPKPYIVILGKLGGAEDFGSTNFMPGNMGIRCDAILDQIPGDPAEYFKGKEICVTGTPNETPVGTIGMEVTDMSQWTIK